MRSPRSHRCTAVARHADCRGPRATSRPPHATSPPPHIRSSARAPRLRTAPVSRAAARAQHAAGEPASRRSGLPSGMTAGWRDIHSGRRSRQRRRHPRRGRTSCRGRTASTCRPQTSWMTPTAPGGGCRPGLALGHRPEHRTGGHVVAVAAGDAPGSDGHGADEQRGSPRAPPRRAARAPSAPGARRCRGTRSCRSPDAVEAAHPVQRVRPGRAAPRRHRRCAPATQLLLGRRGFGQPSGAPSSLGGAPACRAPARRPAADRVTDARDHLVAEQHDPRRRCDQRPAPRPVPAVPTAPGRYRARRPRPRAGRGRNRSTSPSSLTDVPPSGEPPPPPNERGTARRRPAEDPPAGRLALRP